MLHRAVVFTALATLMLAVSSGAQQSSPSAAPKKAPAAAPKQAPANVSGIAPATEPSTFADRKLEIPTVAALLKKTPKDAVDTVAEINGLVRGGQRTTSSYNVLEFTATGTMAEPGADGKWQEYKISKLVAGMDFVLPALRFDVTFTGPSGHAEHQIRVASGKQAWNEEKPGINGTPMPETTVEDRLRLVWLTPTAALWGALRAEDAGDKVTVAEEGGKATISYTMKNGEPVKIVLNAGMTPQRIEIQAHSHAFGNTLMEADCSAYKDFEGYAAPFPTRLTYKAGARTILDLNISNHVVNPYVVFLVPTNMSK
jgi:hypothetical protein